MSLMDPMLSDFKPGTVAWVIQRVIEDVAANPSIKQFGESHLATLKATQRLQIGQKIADKLTEEDIIEQCKALRSREKKPLTAATVNQYVTYLRNAMIYAKSSFRECKSISLVPFVDSKPFLRKRGIIGKGLRRNRRPTDEEIAALLADLKAHEKRSSVPMCDIVAAGLASSRRVGELCRITHGDVDYEQKIYWIRDIKHPTRKKGNDKPAILWPELETIIKRQPRKNLNDPNERIFPVLSKTVTKLYIDAKKRCGIEGLRLHDNRREAISRFLLVMAPEDVQKGVSLHDSLKTLEAHYDARKPTEIIKEKYKHLLEARA